MACGPSYPLTLRVYSATPWGILRQSFFSSVYSAYRPPRPHLESASSRFILSGSWEEAAAAAEPAAAAAARPSCSQMLPPSSTSQPL